MSAARRSERLRRKRQSTPGLTQPGAYSLYGSGYVVESDASFLPSQSDGPKTYASRRLRYRDSPHRYAEESAPSMEEAVEVTPERRRRRNSVVDRVRVSLFDILGSAARRPVSNDWRAVNNAAVGEDEEEEEVFVDDAVADDAQDARSGYPVFLMRHRRMLPIAALFALFAAAIPVLLAMEANVYDRFPYWKRAERPPTWEIVRDTYSSAVPRLPSLPSMPSAPSLPSLPSLPHVPALSSLSAPEVVRATAENTKFGAWKTYAALAAAWQYLFRGAWAGRSLRSREDYVSRIELEDVILPSVVTEARRAAVEEVTRTARKLPAVPDNKDNFAGFAERYAADKGLPADYALLSAGASVDSSEPSTTWMYARFVRKYLEAIVTGADYTPAAPQSPQVVLMPDVLPGNCWAFPGYEGSLTIRLARPVRPTSITMEHTPKRSVFSTMSAPRRFRVFGVPLKATKAAVGELVPLGEFLFDASDEMRHLQSFVLGGGMDMGEMRAVKVEILSNHGAEHTSVYRVRVHGVGSVRM